MPHLDENAIRTHPLCGPLDRMPAEYRGPRRLGRDGWLNFVQRLGRGEEIDLVRAATAGGRRILDVGGGTGELTRAVAAESGRCTTVEPHRDRVATLHLATEAEGAGVIEAFPGRAESLPFPDASFDVVFSTWVLPFVDDLQRSVREMARVCDLSDPGARILLIGGAPDNELINILNEVCAPIAGEPYDHHGFLLVTAAEILAEEGFRRFALQRTESALHFPEISLEERIDAACTVLVDFWYEGHPRAADMRSALRPAVRGHFERRPHAIGDQGTVLVARPGAPS
ncbi:class I SAM-dependent methyltransferase [Streptomyces sp. MP131-18]|uniref:class I SAM-dependent methyltransferase n=1 Tax=Streptomyces sp. MP131-18 TaxID=1857892 RepID=UPI00097C0C0A|nr:class I SAM-dependent methyltransferase [Streptomyces sp. MP131-18]ONK10272.1 putative methyltransferase YcgJ [Streptomyces sp. MP131-18]